MVRRRWWCVVLLAAGSAVVGRAAADEPGAGGAAGPGDGSVPGAREFDEGTAACRGGDYTLAATRFSAAMKANPQDRASARMLAWCAVGDAARVADADAAVAAFPADAEVLHYAGRAWMTKFVSLDAMPTPTRRERAEAHRAERRAALTRAADLLDRAADARGDEAAAAQWAENERWRAVAAERRFEHEKAVTHARAARADGGEGWELAVLEAQALESLSRPAEAAEAYASAIPLAPERRGNLQMAEGVALARAGRAGEAVRAFTEALAAKHDLREARHRLGSAAFSAGDYRLALWAFGDSREVDGATADLWMVGRILYTLGRDDLAEEYITRAIAEAKENLFEGYQVPAGFYHYLGRAQWEQGKRREAIENLTTAARAQPSYVPYVRWLFLAHLADDNPYDALEACRLVGKHDLEAAEGGVAEVLARWPRARLMDIGERPMPHTALARQVMSGLYWEARRYRQALVEFEGLRALSGSGADVRAGWCRLYTGDVAGAEKTFRDALRFYPAASRDYPRLGLACALIQSGQKAEAATLAAEIKREAMLMAAETIRWLAGDRAVPAGVLVSLGYVEDRQLGKSNGSLVSLVLPGGLLAGASPRLRPGDVILSVDGLPLGDAEQEKAAKARPVAGKVTVRIRRGGTYWTMELDSTAATSRPTTAPAGRTEVGR